MGICEEDIFKGIFQNWNQKLQVFVQARGLSMQAAADVVQEVFLKAWKNCQSIDLKDAHSYLFKMASNLQIDLYRKEKVRLKYKESLLSKRDLEDGQFRMEAKEFQTKIEEAINSMSAASKEVFMLSRFQDMSYKEIAKSLNLSIKAVEKRMSKALAHLVQKNIFKKK